MTPQQVVAGTALCVTTRHQKDAFAGLPAPSRCVWAWVEPTGSYSPGRRVSSTAREEPGAFQHVRKWELREGFQEEAFSKVAP